MISFVILHYNSYADTKRCVDSILNLKYREKSVVIVDNNSPDNSIDLIDNDYEKKDNVVVIRNKENYGFSKGNNIGCKYAIENYSPKIICVFNNDIYIKDPELIDKILNKYVETKFDVLGTKITLSESGINQNPINVTTSIPEIDKEIKRMEISKKILNSPIPYLYWGYNKLFSLLSKNTQSTQSLYGAALIFSENYYRKFDKIFPEITFMYGEENFIYYRKVKYSLNFIYEEGIEVIHNHSASTKKSMKSVVNRWKFQNKFMLIAKKKLKDVYLDDADI